MFGRGEINCEARQTLLHVAANWFKVGFSSRGEVVCSDMSTGRITDCLWGGNARKCFQQGLRGPEVSCNFSKAAGKAQI